MEIENSKPNERKEDKCVDYAGMNILHLAVRFHPKAVQPLLIVLQDDYLTKGLINQQTSFTGETPLHLAARIGDIDVVQQLLKHLAGMARPLTCKKRFSILFSVPSRSTEKKGSIQACLLAF